MNEHLKGLHAELSAQHTAGGLRADGFLLYLYALVLKGLDMKPQCSALLCEAVRVCPCNWSAWQELSSMCNNKDELDAMELPAHWTRHMFLAQLSSELQVEPQEEEAAHSMDDLDEGARSHAASAGDHFRVLEAVFPNSTCVQALGRVLWRIL